MTSPVIDWGMAVLSLTGQRQSGDAYAVKDWDRKCLAVAIDGLGHGEEAAEAARIAVETLISHAQGSADIISLVQRCHQSLAKTRGVVLSLALFDALKDTMTWLGVGNVDGLLIRADPQASPARESLLARGGIVGYQMPPLRASTLHIGRGDLLIFSTDGIRSGFQQSVNPEEPPQLIAEQILMNYGRKTDDALVLAARYIGCS